MPKPSQSSPSTPSGLVLRNGVYHMRFRLNGVKVAESTHTGNTREAESILAKRKSEIVRETVLAGKKPIKLHDAIDKFVASRAHTAGGKNTRNHLQLFKLSINDKYLSNVSLEEVQDVIQERLADNIALSTCAVTVNYWNAFINYITELGYSAAPKMRILKGVKHKIRILSVDEQAALFAAIDPNTNYEGKSDVNDAFRQDNLDLCWMLLHTGCRYSEMANMKWTQVDFKEETVHIIRGKKGRDSTLHMTQKMKEILLRRKSIAANEWIFDAKQGRHNETHWMQRAVKNAGLDTSNGSVSLHVLRHTAATRWLQAGLSIVEVQQMLGHADIKSTMVYLNYVPNHTAKRAAQLIDAASNVDNLQAQ